MAQQSVVDSQQGKLTVLLTNWSEMDITVPKDAEIARGLEVEPTPITLHRGAWQIPLTVEGDLPSVEALPEMVFYRSKIIIASE